MMFFKDDLEQSITFMKQNLLNDALNGKDYDENLLKEINEKLKESGKKLELLLDMNK